MEPPTGVTLRGYTRDDLDAMFRLDQVCFTEPFRFSRSDMRRFAEACNAQVRLAMAEKDLAGFSIVHTERSAGAKVGYLLTLDVAPAYRRRGVAQWLLEAAEDAAQQADCAAMALHVHTANTAAIGLYEKLGYVKVEVAEHFYSQDVHAWVYRKLL